MRPDNVLWNIFLTPNEFEHMLLWAHLLSAMTGFALSCWALWSAIGDYHAYEGDDKSTKLEGMRAVRNEAFHIKQQALMLIIASMSFSNTWWIPSIDPSVRIILILMTGLLVFGAAANRKDRIRQYQYARDRDRRQGERNNVTGNEPEEFAG